MKLTIIKIRIGYQKKGWTDGEIGVEWIKIFDEATKEKADGEYRLLLVDGHNSHYTVGFLFYARDHKIIVICYPAHGTHIYQGLDIVIFSVLKRHLADLRDALLRRTGQAVDKTNFLEIYAQAHNLALTPENIKVAFRKTGVWPFDPSVVTPEMMAPSKETLSESHMPLPPPEPVKILATMLRKLNLENGGGNQNESHGIMGSDKQNLSVSSVDSEIISQTRIQILEDTVNNLKKTNLLHLIKTAPTTSSHTMPQSQTTSQPDHKDPMTAAALRIQPATKNELLAALRESERRTQQAEAHAFTLQASNILNEAYTQKIKHQLAQQEEKKGKKKGTARLVGDGLPRLLSGDAFYKAALAKETELEEAEKRKTSKKDGKAAYRKAIEAWNIEEKDRKAANVDILNENRLDLYEWEKKRDAAKKNGSKAPLKPKKEDLIKAVPKPKMKDFIEKDDAHEAESELGDDGEENDDEGSETD
jgi:hypothetical protein